jgi:hypothetical protein
LVQGGQNEWDLPEIGLRRLGGQDIQLFWKRFAVAHGEGLSHGSLYSRWRVVSDDTVISLYLTNHSVGLFVRGQRGEPYSATARRLAGYEPELGAALGVALRGEYPLCYLTSHRIATTDTKAWPSAFDWLLAAEQRYEAVLLSILSERGPERSD